MLRVAIAEDHAILRDGLRALLAKEGDIDLCGEAADGHGAVEMAARERPDVLVLDIGLPGLNGVDALRRIRAATPRTAVVVLSMHASPSIVRAALRAGASGYVVKGRGVADLLAAVRAAASGDAFFSPEVARIVRDESLRAPAHDADPFEALTPREREVLALVARGRTSKEIAAALGLSAKTVEGHRERLREKLGLRTTADLVRFAIEHGLD